MLTETLMSDTLPFSPAKDVQVGQMASASSTTEEEK
jgi:hypothetical protein